jgi:hypothetical protein
LTLRGLGRILNGEAGSLAQERKAMPRTVKMKNILTVKNPFFCRDPDLFMDISP